MSDLSFLTNLAVQIGEGNRERGFREEGDDVRRLALAKGNLAEFNDARLADYYSKRLLLVISEATEAFEELRSGHAVDERWYSGPISDPVTGLSYAANFSVNRDGTPRKPEGIPSELADILIRVLDFFDEIGVDAGEVVAEKLAYNATRPFKHGRKF